MTDTYNKPTICRLLTPTGWKVVDEKTWWYSDGTADMWMTHEGWRDSGGFSTRILEINPAEFVPPPKVRNQKR